MNVTTRKIKGRTYTVKTSVDAGSLWMSIDDVAAEKVYFSQQYKVYFAPFRLAEGNYWLVAYNNNAYLCRGGDFMREEDFLRDYAPKAFPLAITILLIITLIALPCLALMLMVESMRYIALLFAGVLTFFFLMVNQAPMASRKTRRIVLVVWPLVGLALEALLFCFFV